MFFLISQFSKAEDSTVNQMIFIIAISMLFAMSCNSFFVFCANSKKEKKDKILEITPQVHFSFFQFFTEFSGYHTITLFKTVEDEG